MDPTLRPGLGSGRQVQAALGLRLGSRTNKPSQGLAIDWFLQEPIERPDLASGLIFCGADENQHRRTVEPITLTDLGGQRPAVGVRHLQIDQYRVEVRAGQ